MVLSGRSSTMVPGIWENTARNSRDPSWNSPGPPSSTECEAMQCICHHLVDCALLRYVQRASTRDMSISLRPGLATVHEIWLRHDLRT